MSLTQSMASAQTLSGLSRPSATLRRSSRRPFTAVASCEKKSVARTVPSAVQQILTAGAASALVLVSTAPAIRASWRLASTELLLRLQAQPAFADVNLVAQLSESSGPVEQLKGKFFGPQVCLLPRTKAGKPPCAVWPLFRHRRCDAGGSRPTKGLR